MKRGGQRSNVAVERQWAMLALLDYIRSLVEASGKNVLSRQEVLYFLELVRTDPSLFSSEVVKAADEFQATDQPTRQVA